MISDFSGVDVYENDGRGYFTDMTDKWIPERANFGMSCALADFNSDGALDIYVTGMASTTARRLDALGLGLTDFPEHQPMRTRMGYGNRLYLRGASGGFDTPPWETQVARSGWSWGTVSLD